jgi:hypothetical protein
MPVSRLGRRVFSRTGLQFVSKTRRLSYHLSVTRARRVSQFR